MSNATATTYTTTTPPLLYDPKAEEAVIGSILLDRDAIAGVADLLVAGDFFTEAMAMIYQAALALFDRRTPPDLITLRAELSARGPAPDEGDWAPYLINLSNAVPTAVHIRYYGELVKQFSVVRESYRALNQMAQGLGRNDVPVGERLADANAVWAKAMSAETGDQGLISSGSLADELWNYWQTAAAAPLPTGLPDLDTALGGGLWRSDLIVVGARPSVGKTSLALTLASNFTRKHQRVAFFSLEMKRIQLGLRLAAMETGIALPDLRKAPIKPEMIDSPEIVDFLGRLQSADALLSIDEVPGRTPFQIETQCNRRIQQTGQPLDLVIIDYIGLMQPDVRTENRSQAIGTMTRALKTMAKRLDVPVLLLAQLNRGPEARTSHIPMLSDLRESGDLEQDSDVVIFPYREEMHNPDTDKKGIMEMHIAKQRNGPTGVVPLRWMASTASVQSLYTRYVPEGY